MAAGATWPACRRPCSLRSGAGSLPGAPAAPRTPEAVVASTSSESSFFEGRQWVWVVTSPLSSAALPHPRLLTEAVSSQPQLFPPSAASAAAGPWGHSRSPRCWVRGFPQLLWLHSGAHSGYLIQALGAWDSRPSGTHGNHLQTSVGPSVCVCGGVPKFAERTLQRGRKAQEGGGSFDTWAHLDMWCGLWEPRLLS